MNLCQQEAGQCGKPMGNMSQTSERPKYLSPRRHCGLLGLFTDQQMFSKAADRHTCHSRMQTVEPSESYSTKRKSLIMFLVLLGTQVGHMKDICSFAKLLLKSPHCAVCSSEGACCGFSLC